jgi:putative tryptophan/tyrosine transport system substrate-binding protein
MRRREFIAGLGGAAAWPVIAWAQQPAMPVIGFLNGASPVPWAPLVAAFRQGLSDTGYVEDRNVTIEYRWAEGHYDRMPDLAADLVHRQVAVIAATGGDPSALAAMAATKTIPIVFSAGGDPIKRGLVESLNRPGGNITGVYFFTAEMEGKRVGLLHELVPTAATVAALVNPTYPDFATQLEEVDEAARSLGLQVRILRASTEREIDMAFAAIAQLRAEAMVVCADPFFNSRRAQLVALAALHRLPAVYEQRVYVLAGGLMSYGTSITEAYHQVGIYTGRILKGEKPSDLPVVQSAKFEFVINLKTAKTLGLDVPPGLSARADEVIE